MTDWHCLHLLLWGILPIENWHPAGTELWSRKHAPKEEAQLIVHKKKLAELRDFLRSSTEENGTAPSSKLLLVSGCIPGAPSLSLPPSKKQPLPSRSAILPGEVELRRQCSA